MTQPLALTELVLRDAHQSLLATRLRLEDMLPIAHKLDEVGFWSLETWGGATFDACIRFLGEDPWERLRQLKKAIPKTRHQMLLRGQNLLGYRHYADDVVTRFVERAHETGIDVFRIFDALNDIRNLHAATRAALKVGAHVQGTLSYTTSPVHSLSTWVDFAKRLEDLGCHSLCIKDMSGLLRPYEAEDLITALKQAVDVPIALHCHATTGLSLLAQMKAIDAGVDIIDTAISPMSMTYGHSPTETLVAGIEGTQRDTGIKLDVLEDIAAYFRDVRKKYTAFEGQLKGIDARILTAQVPGGMLTNMEHQLQEQNALARMPEVLAEIPKVREDLGYLPLVTPASQIVGTQAVLNVLAGERYKTMTKETTAILKGEYGKTPAPVNAQLQKQVVGDKKPITHRPADDLQPEMQTLEKELQQQAEQHHFKRSQNPIDDTLTYALFPQVSLKFFQNRHNPSAFEPTPTTASQSVKIPEPVNISDSRPAMYRVRVNNQTFDVEVSAQGTATAVNSVQEKTQAIPQTLQGQTITAPLAGNVFKLNAHLGDNVQAGDVVIILEAMKMETEVRSEISGTVQSVHVHEGQQIALGAPLIDIR